MHRRYRGSIFFRSVYDVTRGGYYAARYTGRRAYALSAAGLGWIYSTYKHLSQNRRKHPNPIRDYSSSRPPSSTIAFKSRPNFKFSNQRYSIMPKRKASTSAATSSKRSKYVTKTDLSKALRNLSEKKFIKADVSGDFTDVGVITSLCQIGVGDTDETRDGDTIKLRSIQGVLRALPGLTASLTIRTTLRVVVFQWLQDTTPTMSQIMANSGGGTEFAPLVPYSHDTRHLFRILYDKIFQINGARNSVSHGTGHIVRFFINMGLLQKKGKAKSEVRFEASGLTAANKVYMLTIGDQDPTSANRAEWALSYKTNYSDS